MATPEAEDLIVGTRFRAKWYQVFPFSDNDTITTTSMTTHRPPKISTQARLNLPNAMI
jgi:hypothetical protein